MNPIQLIHEAKAKGFEVCIMTSGSNFLVILTLHTEHGSSRQEFCGDDLHAVAARAFLHLHRYAEVTA